MFHMARDDAYLKHRSFRTCTVSRLQCSKTCSCSSRMCVNWFLLTGLTLFFGSATGTREVVYPFITHNEAILYRSRRSTDIQDTNSLEIVIDRPSDPFVLSLTPSRHLITAETIIEWITESGERWKERPTSHDRHCLYSGIVKTAEDNSVVALNICDGFTGLIQIHDQTYFLERDAFSANNQGRPPHLLYTLDEKDTFLSLAYDQDYGKLNNLTRRNKRSVDYDEEGNEVLNTIDEETDDYYIDEDLDDDDDYFDNTIPELPHENYTSPESNNTTDHLKPKEDVPKLAAENETSNDVLDWDGYAPDKLWELPEHRPQEARRKKPDEKVKIQDSQKWLEIAIAVDYTVIKFHGRSRVQQYVLTLMNIVSAIYEDPSLEANMRLVISRLVFLEDRKLGQVREGNSKRSLENVNAWNSALLRGDAAQHPHDVAVWLTRLDLGGPSGYAPVSGVCDSERSCSLNRDEGLTSAFIIAHEVGHVLGFSHDGDSIAANDCADEAVQGSVMAPMVAATFSRFHWSKCTHSEYHFKKEQWRCMRNQPTDANATVVKSSIQSSYSLDEQCRMEFGEGYSLCRSFGISDPCTHLWCGHRSSPERCKTKKGPPLEGTVCGPNMWCIRGYCEVVGKRRRVESPVARNPRDGEWSAWTEWGSCSRTCGTGVRFRSRKCDNPTPLHGGKPCQGHAEEFDLCNTAPCKKLSDFRAEQCRLLPQLLGFDKKDKRTWSPWQINNETLHCYLTCRAQQSGEIFRTQELVIDGTPCSYEDPHKICIQGRCYVVGCDRRIGSNIRENECGVCGGKTGNCTVVNRQYHGRPKEPHRRMVILPRGARNILIEETPSTSHALSLMDRKSRKWVHHAPDTRGQDFNDVVITHGVRFIYTSTNGKESLRAQGPLHSDLLLMVIPGPSKETVHVTATWSVPPKSKTKDASEENRYVWEMAGWTPCSKTCGGGLQNQVAMCKDLKLNRVTKKRYCSTLKEEPMANVRFCNVFNCHFRWVVGPWEGCSHTCGQNGVQMRMLYCVKTKLIETMHLSYSPAYSSPNQTNKAIERALSTGSASEARRGTGIENETNGKSEVIPKVSSWNPLVYDPAGMDNIEQFPVYQDSRSFADPALCKDPKPDDMRPCNRQICPGHWKEKEWGPCSQTCGEGVQIATLVCEPFDTVDLYNNLTSESGNSSLTHSQSEDVDCGPKPDYVRKCQNLYPCKLAKCIKDESHYCSLPNLRRYCIVPEFRRRCCITCKGYPR